MPLIDLSLPQLHEYQGRNPRPADVQSFWDASLDELKSVPNELENKPFEGLILPGAECFEVTYNGTKGARIYAKFVRPTGAINVPCVLWFHGYTGRSPDYWNLLSWISAGYSVLAMDCRGQGGRSTDPGGTTGNTHRGHIIRGLNDSPEMLYYRNVFLDAARLAEIAAQLPRVDVKNIFATGASQGGGLTLACAGLVPGLRACAPQIPFLTDYLRVWEMDQAKDAYQELRDYMRMFDPVHEHKDEMFTKLGYIDVQFLSERIKCPTLLVTGLMDSITPPSTQFAAYNKISAHKEILIYPDYGHEGFPQSAEAIYQFFERNRI